MGAAGGRAVEDTEQRAKKWRHRLGALVLAVAVVCPMGFLIVVGGGAMQGDSAFACEETGSVNPGAIVDGFDSEQMTNAITIVMVGQEMDVPRRGWVIAVATAIQESTLRILDGGPDDSLGLFQQRPSQGWGTPEQIKDPEYSSRKFYEKLLTVDGWEAMPLTEAAQRVQRSAYPDAYARHEGKATELVNAAAGEAPADCVALEPGEISPSGWTKPVTGAVGSGFRTSSRPNHQGVDIMVAKYTPIVAASGGVVIVSRCDNPSESFCDHDGSPTAGGCGWFVDILHASDIITRYCHQWRRPDVAVGDTVAAGQKIGEIGSSGNSSGPHLHYEVHVNGDRSRNGAIDPVEFMISQGAPLG